MSAPSLSLLSDSLGLVGAGGLIAGKSLWQLWGCYDLAAVSVFSAVTADTSVICSPQQISEWGILSGQGHGFS